MTLACTDICSRFSPRTHGREGLHSWTETGADVGSSEGHGDRRYIRGADCQGQALQARQDAFRIAEDPRKLQVERTHRPGLVRRICAQEGVPALRRAISRPRSRSESRYLALVDLVDLIGVEKLLGVAQVHLPAHKYVEQVRVDVSVQLEVSEDLQRFGKRLAALVGPVLGSQRLEYIGDPHDPRLNRHLLPFQSTSVTLPVHAFVD